MSSPFASPAAASGGIDYKEINGRLLIITPTAFETGINTSLGAKDAVRADITVIDGAMAGDIKSDTLIFPKVLIGQLRPKIGQKVIGRLGQGQAKPGQNAPWVLHEATPDDLAAGVAWLNKTSLTTASSNGSTPPF